MSGKNNVWFNHGGKLSPWSDKFKYADSFDINECKSVAIQKSIQKRHDDPACTNVNLEYYTSRGMTRDEAAIARRERQSTFTLKKCQDKYRSR